MSNTRMKLNEAAYFASRMNEVASQREPFVFNLSAFLAAARSVTLFMLEEYADAPGFKEWWTAEVAKAEADQAVKERLELFNEKRVTTIHHEPVIPAANVMVEVHDVIHMTDSVIVTVTDETGQASTHRAAASPDPVPAAKPREPRVEWRWYFDELPGADVVTACQIQLGWLRDVVDECERRFGSGG